MTDGAACLLRQGIQKSSRPTPFTFQILSPVDLHTKEQPGVEKSLNEAYLKLISRGGPGDAERWTSGQWMAESPRDSHVPKPETVAVYSPLSIEELGELGLSQGDGLGPWVISDYKPFSSTVDANMTIVLARTTGARGLSAFYAPLKMPPVLSFPKTEYPGHKGGPERNGVPTLRQETTVGKTPVASTQIELDEMRGWLVRLGSNCDCFTN